MLTKIDIFRMIYNGMNYTLNIAMNTEKAEKGSPSGEDKNLNLSETAGNLLKKNKLTISTAESCTGGALADAVTNIAGSSRYFKGGIISYDNAVKTEVLEINKKDLDKFGAVSKPVALQMAKNIADLMQTDIGVSTTGIAGPGGGSDAKPVGTVWIGYWSGTKHFALKALFTSDRLINKKRTVEIALDMVRRITSGIEEMPAGLKPHFPE